MKPVTGSLNVTLGPVTVARVTPTDAYFGIAESLMPGARVLGAATGVPGTALTLVAGHILECLLKAVLAKSGTPEKELKKVRHNLEELWRLCVAQGNLPTADVPAWAKRLSDLHGAPYHLRYPVGLNGLVLPGVHPMLAQLEKLLEVVRGKLR
jgi:hypothetical protein